MTYDEDGRLVDPEVSVVIPVFNEEKILVRSVETLREQLVKASLSFEIVLAENGSWDRTRQLATMLSENYEEVSTFSYPEPNYGGALREGIFRAEGEYVVCEEIDLCLVDFHLRALELLRDGKAHLVVGSKAMTGANDRRPLFRRLATKAYNFLLRMLFGFTGTDTHGLKAFRRPKILPIAESCVVEHDVFASELVIRAERARVKLLEVPIELEEKRAPSIHLWRRVPRVLNNLLQLMLAIHGPQPKGSSSRTSEDSR